MAIARVRNPEVHLHTGTDDPASFTVGQAGDAPTFAVVTVIQKNNAATASDEITSVTLGGTGMTQHASSPWTKNNGTDNGVVYLFSLSNPGSDALTLSIDWSANEGTDREIIYDAYTGDSPTFEDVQVDNTETLKTDPLVSLTIGEASEVSVGGICGVSNPAAINANTDYTEILEQGGNNAHSVFYMRTSQVSTDEDAGYDSNNATHLVLAYAVKEVASGASIGPIAAHYNLTLKG